MARPEGAAQRAVRGMSGISGGLAVTLCRPPEDRLYTSCLWPYRFRRFAVGNRCTEIDERALQRIMIARMALFLGGLFAALLTPPFALSYFLSYGLPSESPPGWLAQLQDPLTNAGLLDAGSTSTYDRYGLLYLAAWILALVGLAGLLQRQWPGYMPRVRRAWVVFVTGLGLVALGILGDYGVSSDVVGGVGFVMTGVGFLTAAVGCGMLGWALSRDRAASSWKSLRVGAFGAISVVGGMALVRHIPSGPGLGFVGGALFLGAAGLGVRRFG